MSQQTQAADHRPQPDSERGQRPLTGQEFLDSLRDDREVWIYGERVKDVTPASWLSEFRPHAGAYV